MLIFDIETGPLADEILQQQFTFEAPPHPGEFNPASVKYGNLKDEAKRAAKLEEAQNAHAVAVANYDQDVVTARDEAWQKFRSDAALSPVSGQVLAIGIRRGDKSGIFAEPTEAETISKFWKKYLACRAEQTKLVGANIAQFDLPFLIRRSWILGVDVPATAYSYSGKWINFDVLFCDIRQLWQLGQQNGCESSLGAMAQALGCGRKTEGVNGGDFAKLWKGTADERRQATSYLLNDLQLTADVAARLGVV